MYFPMVTLNFNFNDIEMSKVVIWAYIGNFEDLTTHVTLDDLEWHWKVKGSNFVILAAIFLDKYLVFHLNHFHDIIGIES